MISVKMLLPSKLITGNEFLRLPIKEDQILRNEKHEINQDSPFAFQLHSKYTFTECLPEH